MENNTEVLDIKAISPYAKIKVYWDYFFITLFV